MSLFLIGYLIKAPRQAKLLSTGLALVLGGAVGNLIDRLLHGHVIDFIHVHNADVWHYPIFNIADMGISIGVALIVIDMLFLEKSVKCHGRNRLQLEMLIQFINKKGGLRSRNPPFLFIIFSDKGY